MKFLILVTLVLAIPNSVEAAGISSRSKRSHFVAHTTAADVSAINN